MYRNKSAQVDGESVKTTNIDVMKTMTINFEYARNVLNGSQKCMGRAAAGPGLDDCQKDNEPLK